MPFTPLDPDYQPRIRASFGRQQVMSTIGAAMVHLAPGEVDLEMAMKPEWGQQYGFMHAGIVSTLLDSSCGYAAFSLIPADTAVLTVEFKVNLLRPAAGERLIARGRVVKPGKSVTFCEGRAYAVEQGKETLVATMSTTVMALPERKDLQEVPGGA
jgi:uncharacterized protein (TIGR00369 family)